MLATLAYHNSSIDNLTEKMTGMNQIEFYKMTGLKDIKTVELSKTYKDDDISEITMGHRNVTCNGKNKEIFVIAVRGTDATIEEWSSNFDVGVDSSNYYDCNNSDWENKNHHKGFDVAAYRLYGAVDGYINSYGQNTDKVVLLTGHSRGAAISNIIGAKLEDTGKYKTYTYTFATPNTTTLSNIDKYKTIFNTVNEDDLVACMPLTKWGFTKYGKTLSVSVGKKYSGTRVALFGDQKTWEEYLQVKSGYNYNEAKKITVKELNKICENRNEIYKYAGDKASHDEKCIYHKKYKLNEKDAKKLLEKQKDKFGKRMSQYAEGCYAVETVNKGRKPEKRYYMATEQKPAFLMMNFADVASTKQHNNIGTGLDRIVDYKREIDKYPDFKYLSGRFNFRLAPRYHWARNFFVWSGADSTSFGEFTHLGGMVHEHMPLTYYVITKEGVH